jgi:hypothetical protein
MCSRGGCDRAISRKCEETFQDEMHSYVTFFHIFIFIKYTKQYLHTLLQLFNFNKIIMQLITWNQISKKNESTR